MYYLLINRYCRIDISRRKKNENTRDNARCFAILFLKYRYCTKVQLLNKTSQFKKL